MGRKPTHGKSRDPLRMCWLNIRQRCMNDRHSRYAQYGGRGIDLAAEWQNDFESFETYILRELGPKPDPSYTLDRIENDKGYHPGNLRWADKATQSQNRRSGWKWGRPLDSV